VPRQSETTSEEEIPSGWWLEEHLRGSKEMLIIYKGVEPKGSVEVDSYEEKVAWIQAISVTLNSILEQP
jgi:hypothetical protein